MWLGLCAFVCARSIRPRARAHFHVMLLAYVSSPNIVGVIVIIATPQQMQRIPLVFVLKEQNDKYTVRQIASMEMAWNVWHRFHTLALSSKKSYRYLRRWNKIFLDFVQQNWCESINQRKWDWKFVLWRWWNGHEQLAEHDKCHGDAGETAIAF